MAHRLTRLERPALCAFLATCLLAPPLAAAPPPVRQAASDTIVGTVRTLDAARGSLRVMTGVGLALQIVEFRLTADTRASADGAALERLTPAPGGAP